MKHESDSTDESVVTLDAYNSDLNLVIDASKYSAHPLTKEGFAFMWAGARATHGVIKGKICYEVKVIEQLDVSHLPADEPNPHVVRVGFSVDSSTLQLGEDPLSYGYGGTGKISTKCQFKNFGPPFMAGDCILAVVNMESDPIEIGFAKNGSFLGWAYKVPKSELQNQALFPHILTKNCSFEVNFGQREEPYFKLPDTVKDYTFVGCLPLDQRVGGTKPPERREDCEMIMMCGLPGAGKSVWAAEYSKKHPEKKYNILGTNDIIDKMKVMGLPRKRNYAGRWDVLIQMATKCLNSMFAIGSKLRRNYILDQTNVYPTAQRRKMRNFDGFKRIAVVVVPSEAEYKRRCDKRDREEGKDIPDSAIYEMKANFKLPEVSDVFDDVMFTELQRDEAEKLVKVYNEEGKAFMGPSRKQFRPNEPDNKGFDNRKGNFGYNRNDMSDSRGNMRSNFGNYQDDQGTRGPGGFGGYSGERGNFNRGGFNDGHGGGYDGGYGGRDYSAGRGGFEDRRSYGDRSNYDSRSSGRESFENTYAGGYSGYDNNRNSGRGGFDGNRGGGRGGFNGSHGGGRGGSDENRGGGYDGNRGGGRGGYSGNRGGGRGGFDSNRGGGRGGFDSNRGSGRGGFDGNREGGRGGFDSNREGGRGGFDSNREGGRGGFEGNRGSGRGGFDSSRGGRRGGFDSSRGGGRGGFDGSRGGGRSGFDGSREGGRGGFDSSRGGGRSGFDGSRGGGRGSFDSRDIRDSYGSARDDSYDTRADTYGMYGTSGREGAGGYSSGYSSDRRYDMGNRPEQSGEMPRSDYRMNENIPGGTRRSGFGYSDYSTGNPAEKISDQGYGNNSNDFKTGTSNTRFQQGSTSTAARGGSRTGLSGDSYSRDSYSSSYSAGSNANAQSNYSNKNYGYGSGSYSDYRPQTTDSYASQSSYTSGTANKSDPIQRYAGSNLDTGSKYTQGSGYSGAETRTRWSSDAPQTAATSVDTYSSQRSQGYTYPKSEQTATGYQDKQTYGYQQPSTASTASQPWMGGTNVTSGSTPAAYGMAQTQWMQQYGQQLSNQYYSQ